MGTLHFACLFLSLSIGEIFGYEIQPVDAVLFIDGVPAYMRMTNSTSLENIYACIMENSRNVNSVVMASQMKGLILDVGRVEENINENMRRLYGRTGQSLWESEEELKMLKTRLARFLTLDYYDNRPEPEPNSNYKFQRSTDLSHGRGRPVAHSGRRESPIATPEQSREPVTRSIDFQPFLTTGKTNPTSFSSSSRKSPTERTATKTYSITAKHYPSPEATATYNIIPVRSFKPNLSPQPFLSGEYIKDEMAAVLSGSGMAVNVTEKPHDGSDTSVNTSDREKDASGQKTLVTGYASSGEFKNLTETNATDIFNRTLTKEGDNSDRSSGKSSEEGDGENEDSLNRRTEKGKVRNLKKSIDGKHENVGPL